jgi:hypothetical protein
VSLFVLSQEIEDRNAANYKKKSNMNSVIYFSFPAVIQSSNFKALVISSSFVIGT